MEDKERDIETKEETIEELNDANKRLEKDIEDLTIAK